jgi:putative DNA primase/helicase
VILAEIARALGGEINGRDRVTAPGPGHSPKDRSLTVRLCSTAPDGFLCHSFAGDDWRECRDYVRQRLGMPDWQPGDGREHHRTIGPADVAKWDFGTISTEVDDRRRTEEDLERIKRAQKLWFEAGDPRGTAAEDYLASRALILHDDIAGSVLRFHPRTPWRNENAGRIDFVPCLIAAFRSIDDNEINAVHRIRVDVPEHWPKTQRRMLGIVHRGAIKLAAAGEELLIAEGLETAMSPREAGMTTPCWALGSVGSISFFPIIHRVRRLLIAAETGDASAHAIKMCRTRWRSASRRTSVIRSSTGSDLNDGVMAMKGAVNG